MVQLPDGVELTLSELQDMATRQQQQIESQQQMLVAKEQRLKFLKQQEMHHNQTSADSERLRRLRDRVEAQELKLRKLRALRGQVDQQKVNNTSLTSELESIRALFNEKEKELSIAVAKVEELTQQLEELRRGRLTNQLFGGNASTSVIELEKLRRELLYRNKLNEQQNNKLVQQREALTRGQEEMNRIDRRIAELQQRLHKKRLLNQELANQINAATTAKQSQLRISKTRNRLRPLSANIAAVEPFKHTPQELPIVAPNAQPERSQDDLHPKLNVIISEDLPEFQPNKKDPKYQTLPVNTKFSAKFNNKVESQIPEEIKSENARHESTSSLVKLDDKSNIIPGQTTNNIPNGKIPSTQTVHSIPAYTPPKSHAMPLAHQTHPQQQMTALPLNHNKQTLVNLAPKPYGSTYTSSLLGSMMSITNRNQPLGNNGSIPSSNSSPKYIPPPAPPPPISSVISPPPPPPPPPVTTTIAITTSSSLPSSTSLTSSFRSTVSLPNTPLTTAVAEKPVTSVQPTTLQQSKSVGGLQSRPSTIYQTSSTRITPVTPHTLSTTPQGILREVENAVGNANNNGANGLPFFKSNSIMATKSNTGSTNFNSETTNTTIATTTISSASTSDLNSAVQNMSSLNETQEQIVNNANLESSANKPSLPPKPSIPQKPTPPPRQIHSSSGEKLKVDTSPDAVDSALNILRGSQLAKANGNYRYASRNTIADTYTQKVGNSLNQYLSNVSHYTRNDNDSEQIPNENNPGNLAPPNEEVEVDNSSRKPSVNDLPIKAKPLTIKKHSGVDPPKLKASSNGNVGTGLHKRPSPPLDNNTSTTNVNNSASSNNANISTVNNDNKIHSHNNIGRNNRVATNVHISINRRIEMPPAFLFPENEAPPPDLNGGNRESSSSNSSAANTDSKNDISNDNVAKIPPPPPPPLAPPPYPGTKSESTWDPNKTLSDICKRSVGDNFVTEDTALIENSGSDKLRTESDQIHENSSHYSSSEVAEDISDNMPIETSVSIVIQESNDPEGDSSGSSNESQSNSALGMVRRAQKGNLKTKGSSKTVRRVSFDPLALLLDASLEGELELVKKTAREVPNPSAANDEGITALHNAICAGHFEIVKFLVEFGCDVNAQDSDGWTPLHCAASCNNLPMVKFLVEHGACIFATTLSDHETAAEKCEEDEEGFDGCSEYLYSIQEKLGILNNGAVYALYEYEAKNSDEVSFKDGEMIIVLRKGDEFEREWWWSRIKNKEGYIPRNLLGLYPRVIPSKQQ